MVYLSAGSSAGPKLRVSLAKGVSTSQMHTTSFLSRTRLNGLFQGQRWVVRGAEWSLCLLFALYKVRSGCNARGGTTCEPFSISFLVAARMTDVWVKESKLLCSF